MRYRISVYSHRFREWRETCTCMQEELARILSYCLEDGRAVRVEICDV